MKQKQNISNIVPTKRNTISIWSVLYVHPRMFSNLASFLREPFVLVHYCRTGNKLRSNEPKAKNKKQNKAVFNDKSASNKL